MGAPDVHEQDFFLAQVTAQLLDPSVNDFPFAGADLDLAGGFPDKRGSFGVPPTSLSCGDREAVGEVPLRDRLEFGVRALGKSAATAASHQNDVARLTQRCADHAAIVARSSHRFRHAAPWRGARGNGHVNRDGKPFRRARRGPTRCFRPHATPEVRRCASPPERSGPCRRRTTAR